MATSSIPTMKANLITQLQARGGLTGVLVINGPPYPNTPREFIALGATTGNQDWQAFGSSTGTRDETYDVGVLISVLREGTDAQAAETRCFALFSELENQVRTDPTINNAVNKASIGDFVLESNAGTDGMSRESRLTVEVSCEAFI